MEVSPELKELCDKLRNNVVRAANAEFYIQKQVLPYQGCYYSFWIAYGMRFFEVARRDRLPLDIECLPFIQELANDGNIQEVFQTESSRHFIQGEPLFNTQSVADMMGNGLAEYADKKDEVEVFDFDQTSTAKRLEEQNGI